MPHTTTSPRAELAAPTARGTVLVVDDEPTTARVVARYLERAGYRTSVASDGARAIEAAAAQPPDLAVLDVMLPQMGGLELMRRLRSEEPNRPAVILLSGRSAVADRIFGLRAGADDYLAKPFSPAELVARVDAVMRRAGPVEAPEGELDFGDLRIDPRGRRVIAAGAEVQLTMREFEL